MIANAYQHATRLHIFMKFGKRDINLSMNLNILKLFKINAIFIFRSFNTTLAFNFKDSEYFAQFRYRPFKIIDFLSYVGGIFGLFAGISVLSFFEIFYFFTLRLTTDFLRYFRK